MFRKMEDFYDSYSSLTGGTTKIFNVLTDRNLDQAVGPGHRTLGQIAWHIVTTIPEMMNRTGLGLGSVDPNSMPPASAKAIADAYRTVTREMVSAVRAAWSDQSLLETDDMYGEPWRRGKSLSALIAHEVHHVGQMTVLLRQAGAKVPGVSGPSKEEWGEYGMQPPRY